LPICHQSFAYAEEVCLALFQDFLSNDRIQSAYGNDGYGDCLFTAAARDAMASFPF
jgi:hypothetical protein